jgi:hypothetical protein
MNEKTPMSRFPGWFVAWAAFTIAAFAWGVGFYGPLEKRTSSLC